MTAMEGHAPTITTLRPGVLRVVHERGTDEFVVSGGFAEITGAGVSVLAEQALPRADYTPEVHARMVEVGGSPARASRAQATSQQPGPRGTDRPGAPARRK
jgi:F-type H+-transporting ATPase subunit epsilon